MPIMVLTTRFTAMGSPCEVQVDGADRADAARIAAVIEAEARRIERKFSRYLSDSVVGQINTRAGVGITLDAETGLLIDYAAHCHAISDGLFDITSGILRRAWTFDGSDRVPDEDQVGALLPLVGWDKVQWHDGVLTLLPGMEIDLGGIAKEYAVDRGVARARAETVVPVLVNFGGDLCVTGPRADGGRWRVLIEAVDDTTASAWLEIAGGAITTSGDARRYVERDGRRYGHILDPRTGMSITGAPRAVTVAAPTCVAAGVLSTLAMLQGAECEAFLEQEGVTAWVIR
jgi:thiamine biosynthesis lipoprotein